jgi:O-antigen/teichoic acid export membrane protein
MFVFFGPPIIVKILSDSYTLAGMFAATFTLLKTPIVLYEGLLISLLPNVSKAIAVKDSFRLMRYIKYSRVFTVFVSLLLIAGAYVFGEAAIAILYGKGYVLDRVHIMLIASIIAIHLFASLYSEILVGMGRIKQAVFSWVFSIIFFVLMLFLSIDVIYRVELGFILYNLFVVIFLGYYLKRE